MLGRVQGLTDEDPLSDEVKVMVLLHQGFGSAGISNGENPIPPLLEELEDS